MARSSIGIVAAALLPLAAWIQAGGAQTVAVPDDAVIRLERTSCFGECPVYTVTIDARGNVIYDGARAVRVEGRQIDRIPLVNVAAILETAERVGFRNEHTAVDDGPIGCRCEIVAQRGRQSEREQ